MKYLKANRNVSCYEFASEDIQKINGYKCTVAKTWGSRKLPSDSWLYTSHEVALQWRVIMSVSLRSVFKHQIVHDIYLKALAWYCLESNFEHLKRKDIWFCTYLISYCLHCERKNNTRNHKLLYLREHNYIRKL